MKKATKIRRGEDGKASFDFAGSRWTFDADGFRSNQTGDTVWFDLRKNDSDNTELRVYDHPDQDFYVVAHGGPIAATTDDAIAVSLTNLVDAVNEDTPAATDNDILFVVLKHLGLNREQMEKQVGEFLLYLKAA